MKKVQNPKSCRTDNIGLAFSLHDLKCGNILNYDTREGEILPTVIDWQDLQWLTEHPEGFNLVHSPIELTEDVLINLGFSIVPDSKKYFNDKIVYELHYFQLNKVYSFAYDAYFLVPSHKAKAAAVSFNSKPIKYVHQLQNLYYCLTGVMLSLS
jgi:hypothetical protein